MPPLLVRPCDWVERRVPPCPSSASSQYRPKRPKDFCEVGRPGVCYCRPKDQRGRYQQPQTRTEFIIITVKDPRPGPSPLLPVGLALRFTIQSLLLHSCFFCYLAAEWRRAGRRHSTAPIERSPKDHTIRAREAAHHHVASSRRGRAPSEKPWWRLHVSRWSGNSVWWENARRHVGGVEHAGHRTVSRLTHESGRGDHGSLDRRHLLAWLHELLLLLVLLLLQGVVEARRPLQNLCRMQRAAIAFRVSELLISEARWALWTHLSLCRATLLQEVWLTIWEMRKRGLALRLRHAHDLFDTWLFRRVATALHELHEKVPAGIRAMFSSTAALTLGIVTVAEEVL